MELKSMTVKRELCLVVHSYVSVQLCTRIKPWMMFQIECFVSFIVIVSRQYSNWLGNALNKLCIAPPHTHTLCSSFLLPPSFLHLYTQSVVLLGPTICPSSEHKLLLHGACTSNSQEKSMRTQNKYSVYNVCQNPSFQSQTQSHTCI